jgi:hypothetical protein
MRYRTHRHRRPVESHLRAERLEGRLVLTASIDFGIGDRVLRVVGSEGNDQAVVGERGANLVVVLTTPDGELTRTLPRAAVRRIRFDGLGGDDTFTNDSRIPSVAVGGLGNDSLAGGSAADQLFGGDDADTIHGRGGNDSLDGEAGDDAVSGGPGNDVLHGHDGDDSLAGETGNDRLFGGADDDTCDGGGGNDVSRGEAGRDRVLGSLGNDWLFGGDDDDIVDGGQGNDVEFGDEGDDDMRGGPGVDVMRGGLGDDSIVGDDGNDSIFGDQGDDRLDGRRGRDRIRGGEGLDHEDDADDRFEDGDRDRDGYDDDHDRPIEAGLVERVLFDSAGAGQAAGTSAGKHDRKYFGFTAADDKRLTVTVPPDSNGRYAEVELKDATTLQELLDVEPSENGRTSGQVAVVAGHTYLLRVRSESALPVGFHINLLLDEGPVTPPAGPGNSVTFENGLAQLVGTSLNEDDRKFFSFTATSSGMLGVTVVADTNGHFADVEVKDLATAAEILEIEPYDSPSRTSGSVGVVAGRSYAIKVRSPFETLAVDFRVDLSITPA